MQVNEDHDELVEGVHRPAQETGGDGMELVTASGAGVLGH